MKKILFLGFILTLMVSVTASAQVSDNKRSRSQREMQSFRHGEGNRYEGRHFYHDGFRYKMARRRAFHDGRISPYERRHLTKMRRHQRHEFHRSRHSRHHHVI